MADHQSSDMEVDDNKVCIFSVQIFLILINTCPVLTSFFFNTSAIQNIIFGIFGYLMTIF